MKSLLFQGTTNFVEPATCGAGRTEVPVTLRHQGRIYRLVARDKIAPEDPYLVLLKAQAHSLQTGEAYNGTPPNRQVRDFLIKQTLII
jgi:hypothetical protein